MSVDAADTSVCVHKCGEGRWFYEQMRLHLKVINDELARLGFAARLAKGDGYFYFSEGEAADWLDKTVKARTINSLTLKEWVADFGGSRS